MRVSFWVYENGEDVRITLGDGAVHDCREGGKNEEGYSYSVAHYELQGEYVVCEASSDSRDCDGRHSESGVIRCHVSKLESGYDTDGRRYPLWEKVEENCRDLSAEAMNY